MNQLFLYLLIPLDVFTDVRSEVKEEVLGDLIKDERVVVQTEDHWKQQQKCPVNDSTFS
jgi:hypothetical protein